jgi:hypothetical protein
MDSHEFIKSKGGGVLLCINNYTFCKQRTKVDGTEYYYCTRRPKCKSSVQIFHGILQMDTLKDVHNHHSIPEEINELKVIQAMRKRAADEPLTSVAKLYRY